MDFNEIGKKIEEQKKKETMSQTRMNRIVLKLYEDVKELQSDNEYIRKRLMALEKKVDSSPTDEGLHWSQLPTRKGRGGGWTEF